MGLSAVTGRLFAGDAPAREDGGAVRPSLCRLLCVFGTRMSLICQAGDMPSGWACVAST